MSTSNPAPALTGGAPALTGVAVAVAANPPRPPAAEPLGAARPAVPGAPVALRTGRRLLADPRGQATAEYALVLLGVAAVALLLAAWATKSGAIGQLFEAVLKQLISRAK